MEVNCSKHGKQKGVWWGGGIFSCGKCGGGHTTQFICDVCDKQKFKSPEEEMKNSTYANLCERCGKV